MEKTLSFFRVFDIAFFAPGMILFGAIWYSHIAESKIASQWKDDAVATVILALFAIALVYLLGLLCHSLQRLVQYLFRRTHNTQSNDSAGAFSPWFMELDKPKRHELATYFWYLRSTCWNFAISVFAAAVICWQGLTIILGALIISIALVLLGLDFERSMWAAVDDS